MPAKLLPTPNRRWLSFALLAALVIATISCLLPEPVSRKLIITRMPKQPVLTTNGWVMVECFSVLGKHWTEYASDLQFYWFANPKTGEALLTMSTDHVFHTGAGLCQARLYGPWLEIIRGPTNVAKPLDKNFIKHFLKAGAQPTTRTNIVEMFYPWANRIAFHINYNFSLRSVKWEDGFLIVYLFEEIRIRRESRVAKLVFDKHWKLVEVKQRMVPLEKAELFTSTPNFPPWMLINQAK